MRQVVRSRDYSIAELAQTLFEECADALFLFDPESEQVKDVNPFAQRLTGFSRKELRGLRMTELLRSEEEGAMGLLRRSWRKTGLLHSQEGYWLRRRDEEAWIPVNLSLTRLHTENGTLALITARDLREIHEAQRRWLESEAKARNLIENLPQCIFLKGRDGRFLAANRAFREALGRKESEILGRNDFDFYPPTLAEKYRADDLCVLNDGRCLECEEENLADGKLRIVRVIKTPLRDGQGNVIGVLGSFWDITERKALEAQLMQAQKMEAVGQLAGGVAHDFNNLLTAVLGNVALLRQRMADADPNRAFLDVIHKASQRAAELTRQLLSFSRRAQYAPKACRLSSALAETVALLEHLLRPRVQLVFQAPGDDRVVHADAGQIAQVLMNLCVNARDAMPEGGRVTVSLCNVSFSAEEAAGKLSARPGAYVRLRVADTGHGIPPEILPRIFEPFFTTKEPGKGTGLGLAMVYGIMQQHGGWIEVHSSPGKGATFDLYLPAQDQVPGEALEPLTE